MSHVKDGQTGCFTARFPSTVWTRVPCGVAPNRVFGSPKNLAPRRAPANGGKPEDIGGNNGDYTVQSAGLISTAAGVLNEVDNVSPNGSSNSWSLQINTNAFDTSGCANATSTGCQGYKQFIFSNGGNLLMQDWLIRFGSNCPSGWRNFTNSNGDLDCVTNSASTPAQVQTLDDLAGLRLEGQAGGPGQSDTVLFSTATGAMYRTTAADTLLDLAGGWSVAEFNIFGDGGGSGAIFSEGALFLVSLGESDNAAALPTCGGTSLTGETNNMTLGPCAVTGGNLPGIQFVEAIPPTVTSVSPNTGSQNGGTSVTITGTGFSPNMEAGFGSYYVGVFNCASSTQCTAQSPRGSGMVDITMGNITAQEGVPGVFSFASPADHFMYGIFPSGLMSPSTGVSAGGTTVVLTGENFGVQPGATAISFQFGNTSIPALNVSCSSTTTCTFTTPPSIPSTGTVVAAVSVTVAGQTAPVGGFTYDPSKTSPPVFSCKACLAAGGRCVVVNGKHVCQGTLQ